MKVTITIKMRPGTTEYEARCYGEITAYMLRLAAKKVYEFPNLNNKVNRRENPKVKVTK